MLYQTLGPDTRVCVRHILSVSSSRSSSGLISSSSFIIQSMAVTWKGQRRVCRRYQNKNKKKKTTKKHRVGRASAGELSERVGGKLNHKCSCMGEDEIRGGWVLNERISSGSSAGEDAGRSWCNQDRKLRIKLWETAFTHRGWGWGLGWGSSISSASFESCQCLNCEHAPQLFWTILYRFLKRPYQPLQNKSMQKLKFGFLNFFFVPPGPLCHILRMSEAPYDAMIAYVSLHGRPPPRVTLFQEHSWIKQ